MHTKKRLRFFLSHEGKPAWPALFILKREDASLKADAHVTNSPDRLFRKFGVEGFARSLIEERQPPDEVFGLNRQRRVGGRDTGGVNNAPSRAEFSTRNSECA